MQLPVKIAVEIEGDEITFDLTGSSDEVPTGYNCPFEGTTVSAMTFITRMIFLDEATYPVFVPAERGHARARQRDRAARARSSTRTSRARASPASARCSAPSTSRCARSRRSSRTRSPPATPRTSHFLAYSGFNEEEGEYWVYLEVDEGSYGGRPGRDGLDSVDCLIANTRNNPIEELEWRFPMRTERYELRDDPCAAGKWRGGIGMVRVNRFLVDTIVSCEGDRVRVRPAVGHLRRPRRARSRYGKVTPPDGRRRVLARRSSPGKTLPAGSTIEIAVPNSGGYGDPLERDPERCSPTCSTVHDGRARRARLRRRRSTARR